MACIVIVDIVFDWNFDNVMIRQKFIMCTYIGGMQDILPRVFKFFSTFSDESPIKRCSLTHIVSIRGRIMIVQVNKSGIEK